MKIFVTLFVLFFVCSGMIIGLLALQYVGVHGPDWITVANITDAHGTICNGVRFCVGFVWYIFLIVSGIVITNQIWKKD